MSMRVLVLIGLVSMSACSSLRVHKANSSFNGSGIRYALPVTMIQVAPQPEGKIDVQVLYLPDSDNTYAIDTECIMSAYAFDVDVDESGFLTRIDFKKNTGAVPQQALASGGVIAAQIANAKNMELVAVQGQVDSALASVDNARKAVASAQTRVEFLESQQQPDGNALNAAKLEYALAVSDLELKTSILERARNTSRTVALSASSVTPLALAAPVLAANADAGNEQRSTPLSIPGQLGPVLYVIDEGVDADKKPYVNLRALPQLDKSAEVRSQTLFETIDVIGSGAPASLWPEDKVFVLGSEEVTFVAEPSLTEIIVFTLRHYKDGEPKGTPVLNVLPIRTDDGTAVSFRPKLNEIGRYELELRGRYKDLRSQTSKIGTYRVKFMITDKASPAPDAASPKE